MYVEMCRVLSKNEFWMVEQWVRELFEGKWKKRKKFVSLEKLNILLKWFTFMNYIFHIKRVESFPILTRSFGTFLVKSCEIWRKGKGNFQKIFLLPSKLLKAQYKIKCLKVVKFWVLPPLAKHIKTWTG